MNRLVDFSSRFRILKGGKISLVVSALLGSVTLSVAAPSGGVVTSGSATINQSGKVTNINQSTQKASINWQKFNIAHDETVNFNQPNVNSITLNRVVGNERSIINGALNANGQVWILNSNGVLFGKNASINTAGLLATTKELSDQDFQAGNYTFKGNSTASVINLGEIDISDSGYATLLANSVSNEGTIKAVKGQVHLVGANEVTINLNGNSIVDLTVDKGVLDALVENKGAVYADGGEIYLTTNAVDELLKGVVNNEGIIEANSFESVTGYVEIFAHGGEAKIGGTITAKDGFVETSGKEFTFNDAKIEAGEWLIDPVNVTIDDSLAIAIETALGTGDVTIETDTPDYSDADTSSGESGTDGNIYVNSEITWNTAQKLTLDAYKDIFINKAITATHANGQVALYYGQGAVENANTADYYVKTPINLKAGDNFFTKLGSDGVETTWTVMTYENIATVLSNGLDHNYALGMDMDASLVSANWQPIGTEDTPFTGNFDGLGHEIDKLTINRPDDFGIGLFGVIEGATIKNIGLTNVNINGGAFVGALVGASMEGTIYNTYVSSGNIQAGDSISIGDGDVPAVVGGLVGVFNGSTVSNSYVSADVTGGDGSAAGGLVGYIVEGSIVTNSYATGSVTVENNSYVGGLVAFNIDSTISNSYASGSVTGGTDAEKGGLVALGNGGVTNSWYDNEANTDISMADKDAYGKTKEEIITALSSLDEWTAGGGNRIEGYSTAAQLTLPELVSFYISDGEILFAGGFGTEADPYEISNWSQLQNINNSNILTQNYYFELLNTLNSSTSDYDNLASSTANGGEGWNPIGDNTNRFLGVFDGQSNIIDGLTINRSGSDYQALFGYTDTGSVIKNIGLNNVDIVGKSNVGGLVGRGIVNISNSYVAGNIEGQNNVGGIMGRANNGTTLRNIYSTGTVTATGIYGGGIIGADDHGLTIENIYSSAIVGDWLGLHERSVANSFYDSEISPEAMGDYGKTTAQMKSISTFSDAGWDITSNAAEDTVWFIYDGYTRPLLKSFLTDITITANDATKTYDGVAYNGSEGVAYSIASPDSSKLLGTLSYGDAKNAGTHTIDLSGLYSTQQGYAIAYQNGTLTIDKKDIDIDSFTANDKTYDGTTTASVTASLVTSDIVSGDELSLDTINGNFIDKNAGENKTVSISSATLGGTDKDNYNLLTTATTTADINKKSLSVNGITANDKTYDGTTSATLSVGGASLSGVISGDTVSGDYSGISGEFEDKNAGENKNIVLSGVSLSGADAINYDVSTANSTATIHKKDIDIDSFTTSDKTYDGTTTASVTASLVASDIISGDELSLDTINGNFSDKNAGEDKTVTVSSIALAGEDKDNYNLLTTSTSLMGDIEKKDITVTAENKTKMLGEKNPELTYTAEGLVLGDELSGELTTLATQTSGIGKYDILQGDIENSNYNIRFVQGILEINQDLTSLITPIVNQNIVQIDIPQLRPQTTTPNNIGQNVAVNFGVGGNQMLISQPIEGQPTQRITLGQARQMQLENGVSGEEVRVPLSRSSMIELINGGVLLPDGVEQELYVAENN